MNKDKILLDRKKENEKEIQISNNNFEKHQKALSY